MVPNNRREFLADVGRGMLVAGLGSGLAFDLGVSRAFADDAPRLTFGKLEPLAGLMQDTPAEKLLPLLVAKLQDGTDLRTLVAAGALANARTFGGQDYTGYHAFMALPPALEMAKELPASHRALPVLKVLYRNSHRIQAHGGQKSEVLHPLPHSHEELTGESLQAATRAADIAKAEAVFAAMTPDAASEAYNALQYAIQDEIDVHRVVLAWRAWTMLDIAGKEYAHTLLRQSVRFCAAFEKGRGGHGIRTLLPKLMDEHRLAGRAAGRKKADDAWVQQLADIIYGDGREKAAEAVAMALAEGFDPEAIGEAMSLASCQLVLRDPGRVKDEGDGKPKGSVHGASVGVHASDSANAWRNIARVSNARNTFASLIVGAFHTAGQHHNKHKTSYLDAPQDRAIALPVQSEALLEMIDRAIRNKDQLEAGLAVKRYGEAKHDEKPLFALLLKYAVSEDGALHAEKYYRTVVEEFAKSRPAHRWQHLIALARVTASENGFPAPGYAEACRLMKV